MKKRELNFEILRIISMLLIVAHHFVLYANDLNMIDVNSIKSWFLNFLLVGGKFGVILFVLITGYFSCNQEYKNKKILKIFLHTEFISLVCLIFGIILKEELSVKILLKSIFPIIFNQYWFMSSYVVLFLLIPYLNKFIKNLSKKEFLSFLIILSLFINLIPSITLSNFPFDNIGYLIYIYFIGAYLKLYYDISYKKKYKYIILSIIFYLLAYLLTIGLKIAATNISFLVDKTTFYVSLNSIFLYISAINLFNFFKVIKINPKFNKLILFFSSTSLGIYLIHENYFIRNILWNDLFTSFNFFKFDNFYLNSIIFIVLVYLIASIIDYFYQKLLEKKLLLLVNNVYDFLNNKSIKFLKRRKYL